MNIIHSDPALAVAANLPALSRRRFLHCVLLPSLSLATGSIPLSTNLVHADEAALRTAFNKFAVLYQQMSSKDERVANSYTTYKTTLDSELVLRLSFDHCSGFNTGKTPDGSEYGTGGSIKRIIPLDVINRVSAVVRSDADAGTWVFYIYSDQDDLQTKSHTYRIKRDRDGVETKFQEEYLDFSRSSVSIVCHGRSNTLALREALKMLVDAAK